MGYWVRRILYSIPLIIGMLFVSFVLMRLAPGDPSNMFLDPRMNASDLLQIRKNLSLDQPIPVQFLAWSKRAICGDLGFSTATGQPVIQAISDRLPATLLLSLTSLVMTLVITFLLGIISAAKATKWPDMLITFITFLGMSIPTFWIGLMLILIFSVTLNWLPASGFYDPTLDSSEKIAIIGSTIQHLILPVIACTIGSIAGLTRYYRFGMINILQQPYILAARARGISPWRILSRHAFKNAALPIITLLGMELPGLVSGAYIVEYIFAWPGLGQLGINAAFSRDYPVLMGTLFMSSVLILVGNFLADVMYSWADPRINRNAS